MSHYQNGKKRSEVVYPGGPDNSFIHMSPVRSDGILNLVGRVLNFEVQIYAKGRQLFYFFALLGKLTPGPKKHSFSIIFPPLNLKRSVFRNNLPSVVQPL